MGAILRLNRWANSHTNFAIDAVRVLLGAFLFYRGVFFFAPGNEAETYRLLHSIPGPGANMVLIHYIALAHICGGILVVLGLITRIAIAIQLPILIAAVVVNCIGDVNMIGLLQSGLCFIAAVFFLFYGSGKHSVDYSLKMHM